MKRLALLAVVLVSCDKKAPAPAPQPDGPAKVKVRHILISFAGTPRATTTRSKAEAERLAKEVYERATNGDDFEFMMKRSPKSDDPGPGVYTMVNDGQTAGRDDTPRNGMVKAFGDAAFRMKKDEVVLVPYDPKDSPFGWHIIQRLE